MSYRIFQVSNSQPNWFLSTVLASTTGRWLLCLVALLGAAANASAGINLRITLATTGLPSSEASFADPAPIVDQKAAAAAQREAKSAAQAQLRIQVKALVKRYAAKSDKELTALSAQLQELPRLDRQVLLREVKMRMARQRGRQGSVQIRTERRFGRLLRQADGSVVRVETRVVQVRPVTEGGQANPVQRRKSGYGTGFERRSAPSSSTSVHRTAAPNEAQAASRATQPPLEKPES